MNVLFAIKEEIYSFQEPLGILYLSSVLKKNGHNVFLSGYSFKKLSLLIKEQDIGIFAVSCMNTDYHDYLKLSQKIKEAFEEVLVIWGGPCPTYNPEIIREDAIDIICRGEGETALLELVNRLQRKQDINDIPNLWVKNDASCYKNDLAPLVPDLDTLPFPERSLTKGFMQFSSSPLRTLMASRGCPFNCAYCFNSQFQELYQGKGEAIRVRSVDNVIEELEELKIGYHAKFFYFMDDIFPFQDAWVFEFSEKYSRKIKTPFTIVTSPAFVNRDFVACLKRAGCVSMHLAIECGNEKIRRQVLNKPISDKQIIKAVKAAKEYGLGVCAYNMVGVPFSGFQDELKTLDLNLAAGVDTVHVSFCLPFSDTKLGKAALAAGLLTGQRAFSSWFDRIPIRVKHKKRLERFAYLFPIIIAYPFLRPYLFILLRLPIPKLILRFFKDIVNGYSFKKKIIPVEASFKEFFIMTWSFLIKRSS